MTRAAVDAVRCLQSRHCGDVPGDLAGLYRSGWAARRFMAAFASSFLIGQLRMSNLAD